MVVLTRKNVQTFIFVAINIILQVAAEIILWN